MITNIVVLVLIFALMFRADWIYKLVSGFFSWLKHSRMPMIIIQLLFGLAGFVALTENTDFYCMFGTTPMTILTHIANHAPEQCK